MNNTEYTNRLDKLFNLFSEAYLNFYTWKGLQKKDYETIYRENVNFWNAVLHSLENAWLTGLGKIFEQSSYSKKNKIIGVYALLPFQPDKVKSEKAKIILEENEQIIKGIRALRDNQLAHNNAQHSLNPKVILEKFPIKYAEAENLLKTSGELLHLLNLDPDHGYAFEPFAESCERDAEAVVRKVAYYSTEHKKHLAKFVKGEIGTPKFPPET